MNSNHFWGCLGIITADKDFKQFSSLAQRANVKHRQRPEWSQENLWTKCKYQFRDGNYKKKPNRKSRPEHRIIEMKNSLQGFNSRVNQVEERIAEL